MKKIATSIIAVALLLSVTATGVFAAQGTGAGPRLRGRRR